ncbi:MAG: hypothetical protein N3G20_01835 [Verrucomicrobiae bacterium]|nr:hypothetical protein [Verrucomicrobiae bacterium]
MAGRLLLGLYYRMLSIEDGATALVDPVADVMHKLQGPTRNVGYVGLSVCEGPAGARFVKLA